MPWVLLRTRNKNTGSRVNPTARPCGARPKVANDQVLRVKDPQNMFRGLWTSLGAPKIVQKQLELSLKLSLELSLKLSLELSLKLSLELSLKTQLKTRLQTRVTPLIKENGITRVWRPNIRLNIRLSSRLSLRLSLRLNLRLDLRRDLRLNLRLNLSLIWSPMTPIFNF